MHLQHYTILAVLLVFIFSFIHLGVAVGIITKDRDYGNIFRHEIGLSAFNIVISILGMLVSAAALYSNTAQHKLSGRIAAWLSALLVIFTLASLITSLVINGKSSVNLTQRFTGQMNKYLTDSDARNIIDMIQTEYQCCGRGMWLDWGTVPSMKFTTTPPPTTTTTSFTTTTTTTLPKTTTIIPTTPTTTTTPSTMITTASTTTAPTITIPTTVAASTTTTPTITIPTTTVPAITTTVIPETSTVLETTTIQISTEQVTTATSEATTEKVTTTTQHTTTAQHTTTTQQTTTVQVTTTTQQTTTAQDTTTTQQTTTVQDTTTTQQTTTVQVTTTTQPTTTAQDTTTTQQTTTVQQTTTAQDTTTTQQTTAAQVTTTTQQTTSGQQSTATAQGKFKPLVAINNDARRLRYRRDSNSGGVGLINFWYSKGISAPNTCCSPVDNISNVTSIGICSSPEQFYSDGCLQYITRKANQQDMGIGVINCFLIVIAFVTMIFLFQDPSGKTANGPRDPSEQFEEIEQNELDDPVEASVIDNYF